MTDRLRIAMVGRYYNRQGGTSRCLAEISDRASRSYDVDVYTHEVADRCDSRARFVRTPMLRAPALLEAPSFVLGCAARMRGVAYDVIHSHEAGPPHADIFTAHSCYAAWLRRRRAEAGAWGTLSHVYPPHVVRLALSRPSRRRESFLILAVSQAVKDELEREFGIDPRRVLVVHNGTDTQRFRPSSSRAAARAQLEEQELRDAGAEVALFVAYEFRKRGLGQVIDALARRADPGMELWVLGGDDPEPYRRRAEARGVTRQVRFLGHKAHVEPYFRAADVFVLPTEYDAFGLVILEALASGTPVITSRRAGAAELMTHGREGWLLDDPRDVGELAAALAGFCSARDRRPAMAAAARGLAERNDWDRAWERTAEIYRGVAENKRTGRPVWDGLP